MTSWDPGLHPRGAGGRFTLVRKSQRPAGPAPVEVITSETYAGHWRLSMIRTAPEARGQGAARRAMQELLDRADREGKIVTLTPEPQDRSTSKAKLEAWYRSLGFVRNSGRNKDYEISDAMYRLPRRS